MRYEKKVLQPHNKRNNRIVFHKGEEKTISEWSEELKIPYDTLYKRIRKGWSLEDALSKPVTTRQLQIKKETLFKAFGEEKTFGEWLKDLRCVASYDIVRSRIRKGWDFEKAITAPKLRRRKK